MDVPNFPLFPYDSSRFGFFSRVLRQDGVSSARLGPVAATGGLVVLGGGEASGPLYPPEEIDESMFSCEAGRWGRLDFFWSWVSGRWEMRDRVAGLVGRMVVVMNIFGCRGSRIEGISFV